MQLPHKPQGVEDQAELTLAIIGYPGVVALDIVGPMDAFSMASDSSSGPRYRCLVLSPTGEPFRTESGLTITPDCSLDNAPRGLDTVLIAGGAPIRSAPQREAIGQWLRGREATTRRIGSICIGLYALAASGLIDGRRATTHWRFAADIARCYPRVLVEADSIFVKDGRFWSSAGVTSGIDMALALIQEDFGPGVALAVARDLVVYVKRDGGQAQYSAPLRFQVSARSALGDLVAWIASHPGEDLSVGKLAKRVGVSSRQLARQFVGTFGLPPSRVVEVLRLETARDRLIDTARPVEWISRSAGFASADAFRRAFQRRFGTSPRTYRNRFRVTSRSAAASVRAPLQEAELPRT